MIQKSTEVSKVGDLLAEFKAAMTAGIEGIVRAAEAYVAALEEDPSNAQVFQNEFKDTIPDSAWAQFEAVGRKWMHPRLLLGGVSDRRKASIVRALPYSLQEQVFARKRFPLLTASGESLSVDVLEAPTAHAEQLFDGSSLRSISAQKAYLEAKKAAVKEERTEVMPYSICGGKVTFRRGCEMTRKEIQRLLLEI